MKRHLPAVLILLLAILAAPAHAEEGALAAAETAAAAGDWRAAEAAARAVDLFAADWRDADARLLALAGAADAAGERPALAALVARLADLRQLRLPQGDVMIARTHALAGDLLVEDGRFGEAVTRLDRADHAFARADPPVPAEQAASLLRLADAHAGEGTPDEAAGVLVRAEALFAVAHDPRRAEAAWRAARALRTAGRVEAALDLARRAVADLPGGGAGEDGVHLAAELGESLALAGDLDGARAALLDAIARDAVAGTGLRLGLVASLAGVHARLGRREEGIAVLAEALSGADRGSAEAAMARSQLAGLLLEAGRPREALAAWGEVLAAVERLGLDDMALVAARASLLTNMARTLVALGDGPAAVEAAARAYAASLVLGTAGHDLLATVLAHAEGLALSGDMAGAALRFDEALALAPVAAGSADAILVARDAGRFRLAGRDDPAGAALILRPAVAAFVGALPGAGTGPDGGREVRGEVARLLVGALWRLADHGAAEGPLPGPRASRMRQPPAQ